jgi:hypothetical protein
MAGEEISGGRAHGGSFGGSAIERVGTEPGALVSYEPPAGGRDCARWGSAPVGG